MKRCLANAMIILFLGSPVAAQEAPSETERGFDLLREGSRMILEGILDDMRPMIEEARPFFEEEMLPFLETLGRLIDDLSAYEMPERLPNGDIIIRRIPEQPRPEDAEPEIGAEGEIEL